MSFSEIVVVVAVGMILLKPEDLVSIIRQLKELRNMIYKAKAEFLNELDLTSETPTVQNIEEMNFYLQEIAQLAGEYKGEYSLEAIKKHHQYLVKQQINQQAEAAEKAALPGKVTKIS